MQDRPCAEWPRVYKQNLAEKEYTHGIFQDAPKQSIVMQLGRRLLNMTSKQTRVPVLSMPSMAYWVNGDTGYKQTSTQAWEKVYLTAAELAVIVPIPEAVLSDASFDIMGEVTPRVNEAVGMRVDGQPFYKPARRRTLCSVARRGRHTSCASRGTRGTSCQEKQHSTRAQAGRSRGRKAS